MTARDYLALCDRPPALPSQAHAIRALGRHIPCAALYAEQAERCEALAAWCRAAGGGDGALYAERHGAWGRWWRRMQQAEEAGTRAGPGAGVTTSTATVRARAAGTARENRP